MPLDTSTILIITAVVVVIIIVFMFLASQLGPKDTAWKEQAEQKLRSINHQSQSDNPYQIRQVLVDADKTLDFVMIKRGFRGQNMGERLKQSRSKFDHRLYNDVWEAHKERNKLVHEIDHQINPQMARRHITHLTQAASQLLK